MKQRLSFDVATNHKDFNWVMHSENSVVYVEVPKESALATYAVECALKDEELTVFNAVCIFVTNKDGSWYIPKIQTSKSLGLEFIDDSKSNKTIQQAILQKLGAVRA